MYKGIMGWLLLYTRWRGSVGQGTNL